MQLIICTLCFFTYLHILPAKVIAVEHIDDIDYQTIFSAAKSGHWAEAYARVNDTQNKVLAKLVKWIDYTRPDTRASFLEVTAFIRENPDWPYVTALVRNAESAITQTESNAILKEWFRTYPPLTFKGKLIEIKLLFQDGLHDRGVTTARELWVNGDFSLAQEKQFLTLYGSLLRHEDHTNRLDRLLWEHKISTARRLLSRVDIHQRALAEARILLADGKPEACTALDKVPYKLRNDPGLIYERIRWRRKKGLYLEAISLLSEVSVDKIKPDIFWAERTSLAREALSLGYTSKAYEAVYTHGDLGVNSNKPAEAEWLTGWIAFRHLGDAKLALPHFTSTYKIATTPATLSRAAYWAGRAAEAIGQKEDAVQWYSKAALHITSYYGQLAISKVVNNREPWRLPIDPLRTEIDILKFRHYELIDAISLLKKARQHSVIRPFLFKAHEFAKTAGQHALVADLAVGGGGDSDTSYHDISVALARLSAKSGVTLVTAGYPIIGLNSKEPPEHALVLAVIRQESSFHSGAISTAGARGLMQLMPSTAEWVASKQRIEFAINALTADARYNIALGTTLLGDLIDLFKGSYILALAGYNAGANQPRKWLRELGDPRRSLDDAVDWVESIPFKETRNYVQRVLEGVQVYRRRLGLAQEQQMSLAEDLQR